MLSILTHANEALQALSSEASGLTVSEVAERLQISVSTSSRLLAAMTVADMVEKLPHSHKHVVALDMWPVGAAARRYHRLTDIALGPMVQFVERNGAGVALAVRREQDVIYLQNVERSRGSVVASPIAGRYPLPGNTAGRVMLAFESPESATAAARDASKPARFDGLELEDIEKVRRQGYASNDGELTDGLCGLAFPIFDMNGVANAAMTTVCTATEWAEGFEQRIVPEMGNLAGTVSRFLGFEGRYGIC